MKKPFEWDEYSDQPTILRDKIYKKKMRKKEFISLFKTVFISLFTLPLSIILTPFVKRKEINSKDFFSLGVDYLREPKQTIELLDELEVDRVLLRLKLWEIDSLGELKKFILACGNKKIILKVLQDREHIENSELLIKDFREILENAKDR